MFGHYRLLVLVITLAACLDQTSKALATAMVTDGAVIPIISDVIDLRIRHNTGISWGLGASHPGVVHRVVIPAIGVIIGVALMIFFRRLPLTAQAKRIGVALIMGGGLGNLLDRVRLGYVVDFISVHIGGAQWTMSGTFNLADVWIVIGVVTLALMVLARKEPHTGTTIDGGSP